MPRSAPTPALIERHEELAQANIPVAEACRRTNISTAAYYDWRRRGAAGENGAVAEFFTRVIAFRAGQREAPPGVDDWRSMPSWRKYARTLMLDDGTLWKPERWQDQIVADFIGGYQVVLGVVPEANGKTTLTAGLLLYLLEHQLTPEIPVGSSTATQAETLYRQIEGFIVRSGKLRDFKLAPGVRRIDCRTSGGHLRVYPHNERSGDGVIPSAAGLDELHLHPNLRLFQTWRGKFPKRGGQIIAISTAGEPGSEFEELRTAILRDGKTKTEGKYGQYIRAEIGRTVLHDWAVRRRDDAEKFTVVAAANPLKRIKAPELKAKRAEPGMSLEHWLRFNCNIPARLEGEGIAPEDWEKLIERDLAPEPGAYSIGGLDLAWVADTTALVVLVWESRERRVVADVRILEPPVDEEDVVIALCDMQERWGCDCWVYDPNANGRQMVQLIEKGKHPEQGETKFTFVEYAQQNAKMAVAASRMDEAIRNGWLVVPDDPDLKRHALNAVKRPVGGERWRYDRPQDARGPRRRRYPIDALTALTMAHSQAVGEQESPKPVPMVVMR